ncbi:MAG: hypothetical protein LH473_04415 [Chitinophagales bacterium]|nr:hypothetical protein [Chitinophagales bacterium]
MQEFFSVDTLKPKTIKKIIKWNAILGGTYYFMLLLRILNLFDGELLWYAYNSTYLFGLACTVLTIFTFTSRDKGLIVISVLVFFIGMGAYVFFSPLLSPGLY